MPSLRCCIGGRIRKILRRSCWLPRRIFKEPSLQSARQIANRISMTHMWVLVSLQPIK
jgi:hypothetical protein